MRRTGRCNGDTTAIAVYLSAVGFFFLLFSGRSVSGGDGAMLIEETGKSITLSHPKLNKLKLLTGGDGKKISMLHNRNGIIYIYDLDRNKTVDSIDVKLRKRQYLFDYQVLDHSHVLLALNPTCLGDYHDSAVCIVDRHQKVLRTFSFDGTPVPLFNANSPRAYRNTDWWYAVNSRFPVRFNRSDSSVIVPCSPFRNLTCGPGVYRSKPSFYKVSCRKNAAPVALDFTIPDCDSAFAAAHEKTFQAIPYGDYFSGGRIVIGYPHSSVLFSGKRYQPRLSVYDLSDQDATIEYRQIVYDRFRNCFWWVLEIGNNREFESDIFRPSTELYLARLDTAFNVVAEGFMPAGCSAHILPLETALLIKNYHLTDSLGQACFSYFNLSDKVPTKESLKAHLRKRQDASESGKQAFIKFLNASKKSENHLLISPDRMPPQYAQILTQKLREAKTRKNDCVVHVFTHDKNKFRTEPDDLVHVHSYADLNRYGNKFTWPTLIRTNDQTTIEEFPSGKAKELFSHIETGEW